MILRWLKCLPKQNTNLFKGIPKEKKNPVCNYKKKAKREDSNKMKNERGDVTSETTKILKDYITMNKFITTNWKPRRNG